MIVMNSGSQLSEMTPISHFNFICTCHGLCLLFGQVLPPQDADQMTIVLDRYLKVFSKCLFGHVMSLHSSSSQGSAFEGVIKMHFVFVFFVRSCLHITLIKCLNGHKSLGFLFEGVL